MKCAKSNRVAPLLNSACPQAADRNVSFCEEHISKSSFQAIRKKQCHSQEKPGTCGLQYEPLQVIDGSLNGYNQGIRNHYFTCSSDTLHSPHVELPGIFNSFTKNGNISAVEAISELTEPNPMMLSHKSASMVHRGIRSQPPYTSAVPKEGEKWTPGYMPHENRELHRKSEKENTTAVPCPACGKLSVAVYLVPYQNTVCKNNGGEMSSTAPSHRQHSKNALLIKQSASASSSSMLTWTEYLKCFTCTCPIIEERAFCRHYYALSVICWLSVILTVLIVIAATVPHT